MADDTRLDPFENLEAPEDAADLGTDPPDRNPPEDRDDDPGDRKAAEDLEQLRRERDEYRDLLLRKTAEFENYRKRIDRERRESAGTAAADLLEELLPLVDDLDRALDADVGNDSVEAYRRGVEIIHRQLLDLLRKRGVVPFESVGTDFDPHVHQAVAHEVSPEHREGEVIVEFRRGYKIGDRLLRPAMVKVAKS